MKPIPAKWANLLFDREDQMQAKAIIMISQEIPKFRDKTFHPKNEGFISKLEGEDEKSYLNRKLKEGNRNKAQGMLAGVMDILIVYKGILYKIELKLPNGDLSKDQEKIHDIWNKDCPKITVKVCRSLEEVWHYCWWIIEQDYEINFNKLSLNEMFNFAKWWENNQCVPINLFSNGELVSFYNDYLKTKAS